MTSNEIVWPKKTREYEDMDADSTRWKDFKFRDDDIVIDTLGKSGTTWMMQIVGQLIFEGKDGLFANPISTDHWLDLKVRPIEETLKALEAQTHRRYIKTHLPIDALIFSPKAKYIYVARDMRDILWSWYNAIAGLTHEPKNPPSLPLLPKVDIRTFYLASIDHEPAWKHVQNWWAFRNLPNVLLVHFNNLKADLASEMRRIAAFLDVPLDESLLPQMIEHCGIDYMREKMGEEKDRTAGYANYFFYKGTNGRWKDVLSREEIALADEAAAKYLTPDCAHWLETGEMPKADAGE